MTETEWLGSTDPASMLDQVRDRCGERKLRLYVCAWARDAWHQMGDEQSRTAVVTAERYADGLASAAELALVFNAAQDTWRGIQVDYTGRHGKRGNSPKGSAAAKSVADRARNAADPNLSFLPARNAASWGNAMQRYTRASILRDLFGNPFRTVPVLASSWLVWNAGTIPKLAATIYEEQAFEQMPVLGDALEDAGCGEQTILEHCRQTEQHFLGCWLLDLIVAKE